MLCPQLWYVLQKFFPNKIITYNDKDPIWMNEKIRSKVKSKNQLYKVCMKNGRNEVDFLSLKNSIAELNKLVSTTKISYCENFGEKLNDPTIKTKSYWTILKSFYNNRKIPLISPLLINDKSITDRKTKANIFNKFFPKNVILSVLPTSQHVLTQSILHSIDFSFEEILKIIRSLDVNKSHGHDDISIRTIKICDNSLVGPLSLLFKKSFDNSYFRELWKKLNIISVHKKI